MIRKKEFFSRLAKIPPAIWIIVVMLIYFGFNTQNYFHINNFKNVLIQATPLFIISCGQTLAVLTQGTDLSLGASMSMVMVLWVLLMQYGVSAEIAMIVAVGVAVLAGFINGVVVAKLKLPSFIATLGMMNILNAVALTTSDGSSVYHRHEIYKAFTRGSFLGIPFIIWVSIICFVLTWLLLRKMRFGSRVISLGGNEEALTVSGYNKALATIQVFTYAGLMAGIAGIMMACRIESGNPNAGNGFEFNSMAAVLLGGTSMTEGRGSIIGTVFGVLLIQIVRYSLVLMNVSSVYQTAIIGLVVLLAVVLDASVKRKQEQ